MRVVESASALKLLGQILLPITHNVGSTSWNLTVFCVQRGVILTLTEFHYSHIIHTGFHVTMIHGFLTVN